MKYVQFVTIHQELLVAPECVSSLYCKSRGTQLTILTVVLVCIASCLVDASEAFDTVEHSLLLEKLLRRNLPIYVV